MCANMLLQRALVVLDGCTTGWTQLLSLWQESYGVLINLPGCHGETTNITAWMSWDVVFAQREDGLCSRRRRVSCGQRGCMPTPGRGKWVRRKSTISNFLPPAL